MIKLTNVPWIMTRLDLARYLTRMLDSRVRYTKIIYDKETGLSRGIALVQIDNERVANDILRRGALVIEGRSVNVGYYRQ